MYIRNLKSQLIAENPCPEAWKTRIGTKYPDCELAYYRAYHDGYGGWNLAVFPVNRSLERPQLIGELNAVYDAFTRSFKSIDTMRKWCHENAAQTSDCTEFNAWYIGQYGIFWLRMIARRGDYNLYLHCLDRQKAGY